MYLSMFCFISDGGVSDNRGITKVMTEAAKLPIFWQFVGLGGPWLWHPKKTRRHDRARD